MKATLFAVFAHPDDESFGAGGTLAKYAPNGTRVVLVCATRGEVGEISDASLATPESLTHVREDELRYASQTLRISELNFLDYLDSGMEGTPENLHPKAFIQAPPHEAVDALAQETYPIGVTGVSTYVLNDSCDIVGAQPDEVFFEVLRQIEEKHGKDNPPKLLHHRLEFTYKLWREK